MNWIFRVSATGFEPATTCSYQSDREQEDWVNDIRIFIRDTLGNKNWQIRESKGKARLGIRFDDGTKTYKNIPYKWVY